MIILHSSFILWLKTFHHFVISFETFRTSSSSISPSKLSSVLWLKPSHSSSKSSFWSFYNPIISFEPFTTSSSNNSKTSPSFFSITLLISSSKSKSCSSWITLIFSRAIIIVFKSLLNYSIADKESKALRADFPCFSVKSFLRVVLKITLCTFSRCWLISFISLSFRPFFIRYHFRYRWIKDLPPTRRIAELGV